MVDLLVQCLQVGRSIVLTFLGALDGHLKRLTSAKYRNFPLLRGVTDCSSGQYPEDLLPTTVQRLKRLLSVVRFHKAGHSA